MLPFDPELYRDIVRRALEEDVRDGDITTDATVAPALIAVIWQSLFAKHAPLDAIEMFRVHLDLIFGERRAT